MSVAWCLRVHLAGLLAAIASIAGAQPAGPSQTIAVSDSIRGFAVDSARGHFYVSDYDAGLVARYSLDGSIARVTAPAGRGASALAISTDGRIIACANTLDQTLTLIDPDTFQSIATVPVGKMPSGIAALPGGGFAVANAFSDSVSIVDQAVGQVSAELTGIVSVPSVAGANAGRLAVGVRSPPALRFFSPGQAAPGRTVDLASVPLAIEALSDDRFVVATSTQLLVVHAGSGEVLHRAAAAASSIAVLGTTIYAAGLDFASSFDESLRPSAAGVSPPAIAIEAAGGALFIAAPGMVRVYGEFTPSPAAALIAADVPIVSSATFAAPPRPEPEPVAEAIEPATELEPAAEEAPAAAQASQKPAASAETPSEEAGVETAEISQQAAPEPPRKPQYYPLHAGYLSRGAHAPILGLGRDVAFREELDRALRLEGDTAGLLGLNWQRNPEPERFDSWIRRGEVDTFEGDVEFHVDDAVVQTEKMIRDGGSGDISMDGGVSVERDGESFRAQHLQIRAPEDLSEREALAGIPIVPRGYKPPRQYAYAGYIDAEDLEWSESLRDLTADRFEATFDSQSLDAERVHGRVGSLYFDANRLNISGPESQLAEQAWISTCDHDPPHYTLNFKHADINDGILRIRNARLKLYGISTPIVIPRFKVDTRKDDRRYRPDFQFGSSTNIGTYMNLGQWYSISPYLDLGLRTMPTTNDGFGYGIDAEYDFRGDPRSPLFRSTGSLRSLYTTRERGYLDYRHQQELTLKTRFVGQAQQWSDEDFLNDWFHDAYEDQNGPRTFANFTHTRPGQIFTLTASPSTHGFERYSEKLPEATFHLPERQIANNLYVSWDSFVGYYEFEPAAIATERTVNIARLSYDIQLAQALNLVPFVEADYSAYEDRLGDDRFDDRFGVTGGVTAQTRFQRYFAGIGPYERVKHIVVPSVTYLNRPNPSVDLNRTPQLDGLDFRPGRERVEGKLENVLLAKHAETGDIWQLAQLSLYAGSDIQSEIGTSDDLEIDVSFRPVPKWGVFTSAEHHDAEPGAGDPGGEFNRILSYVFYDNSLQSNTFNMRLGYSYSDLDFPLDQSEVLYGGGVRMGKNWSVGFEHRLELENTEITRQTYELRRLLHDWELAFRVRDREDAVDVAVSFTLIDFPTASLKF